MQRIAQTTLEVFKEPLRIEEHELYVTSSMGIALYPESGDTRSVNRIS
jgi:GGDEF domain-containing protein